MYVFYAYLPPLTVFGTVIDPTHTEKISGNEILAIHGINGYPLFTLLVVVHIGTVRIVLPAELVAVVEFIVPAGAYTLLCAENSFGFILGFHKRDNILGHSGFTVFGRTCKHSVGIKLVSADLCDGKLMIDRRAASCVIRYRHHIAIYRNVALRMQMPRRTRRIDI